MTGKAAYAFLLKAILNQDNKIDCPKLKDSIRKEVEQMPKTPRITALYERLSRDDDLAGESNSITLHIKLSYAATRAASASASVL